LTNGIEGGIPTSLAAKFQDNTTFMKAGVMTPQRMQHAYMCKHWRQCNFDTGENDFTSLHMHQIASVQRLQDTSDFKLFQKKHQKGHEPFVVAKYCQDARPLAKFKFSMKLQDLKPPIGKATKALDDER
jgi:hypothetical protein